MLCNLLRELLYNNSDVINVRIISTSPIGQQYSIRLVDTTLSLAIYWKKTNRGIFENCQPLPIELCVGNISDRYLCLYTMSCDPAAMKQTWLVDAVTQSVWNHCEHLISNGLEIAWEIWASKCLRLKHLKSVSQCLLQVRVVE